MGGVRGSADLNFRYRSRGVREWRGTFAFHLDDEPRIARLTETRIPVIFEGLIDGEAKRLEVMVTDMQPEQGLAHFEALGEPF